jgi:hypothetical protein
VSTILRALRRLQQEREADGRIELGILSPAPRPPRRPGRFAIVAVAIGLAAAVAAALLFAPPELLRRLVFGDQAPEAAAPETAAAAPAAEALETASAPARASQVPQIRRAPPPPVAPAREPAPAAQVPASPPPPAQAALEPDELDEEEAEAAVLEPEAPTPAPAPPPAPAPAPSAPPAREPAPQPVATATATATTTATATAAPVRRVPADTPRERALERAASGDYEAEKAPPPPKPVRERAREPQVSVLSVRWHPDPARREVSIEMPQAGPLEAREGDIVAGVLVKRIEPAAVEVQIGDSLIVVPVTP